MTGESLFEFICAEIICILSLVYIKSYALDLVYEFPKNKKKVKELFLKSPLLDQIFMTKILLANKERRREKICYLVLNLITCCLLIFEVLFLFCRTSFDEKWQTFMCVCVPAGVFIFVICTAPFLVPERFAHRNVSMDQVSGMVLLLGCLFYVLIYVF